MATAEIYNVWEDVGMAFSVEECDSYDPKEWAEHRIAQLLGACQLVYRRTQLPNLSKPVWWEEVDKRLWKCVTWYCMAMERPGISREDDIVAVVEALGAKSSEGKALTKRALDLVEEDWLGAWRADAESSMRYVVTIGRRCVGRKDWRKAQRSLNNRLANAVSKEIALIDKLEASLSSRSTAGSKKGSAD